MNFFLQAIDRFSDTQRRRGFVERNIVARRSYLVAFATWLADRRYRFRPSEITSEDIVQWKLHVAQLQSRDSGMLLRPLTVRGIHSATRSFCFWLMSEGLLPRSVAQSYSVARYTFTYKSALRHAQARKTIQAIPTGMPVGHMLRAIAEVFYSTGARPCEVLRLNIGDIDTEAGTIRLHGKGAKDRVVPIGTQALRWAGSYQHGVRPRFLRNPSQRALWLNRSGNRLSRGMYQHHWSRLARSVSALSGVTAYSFRRSCATELVRSGADLCAVQEQLGHGDVRNLIHYVRTDLADLKKAHARYHPRDRQMDDDTRL